MPIGYKTSVHVPRQIAARFAGSVPAAWSADHRAAGVEFIDEGGPGVRLRKRIHKKPGK